MLNINSIAEHAQNHLFTYKDQKYYWFLQNQ